jgi:outer membrane protein assembly factor BamA
VDTRLTIEQPYLFNKPIFGIWETYATVNKQANYNNTLYGSKLTFQFELPRFTAVNLLSTYYNIEVSKEAYRVRSDSLSDKLISVIGTDFGRTTVNDILFPTSGYIITFQLEEANSLPWAISRIAGSGLTVHYFIKSFITALSIGHLIQEENKFLLQN